MFAILFILMHPALLVGLALLSKLWAWLPAAVPSILFTPENLAKWVGAGIALVFAYFPVLRVRFAALSTEKKSLIMLGLLALATAGIMALNCYGILSAGLSCDQDGWQKAGEVFFWVLVANQGTYLIAPQAPDVKATKAQKLEPVG